MPDSNVTHLSTAQTAARGSGADARGNWLLSIEHLLRGSLDLAQHLGPERLELNEALLEALLCVMREREADRAQN